MPREHEDHHPHLIFSPQSSCLNTMFCGPLRRCKRIFPVIVFFTTLVIVILYRLSQLREAKIHPKHIYRANKQEEYFDRNGVKVIVGHYVGNPVNKVPNATYDMINTVNFNPRPEAGRNGNPVLIEPKDLLKQQQYFQINRFNLLASDRIPLNRTLPDVRRKKCSTMFKDYQGYSRTSIIIVFHNEAWSTLLRTVWSVINRSPRELVEEIILVDDASEREFLKKPLEDYVATLPLPVHVLRTEERVGLIQARLQGARASKAPVLTFLDAHCECTKGWLEPLLSVIKNDRKTIVCPVIDIINDDTFAYVKSFELHWGAFNWNLQFRWYTLGSGEMKRRKLDASVPFNSPTMAGGLFAISKDYFYEIGAYDDGMRIWGGENLEMSFRVWQCGGKIQIAPCSHVGHLFRKSSPYSFPGGINNTLFGNLARVAMVWLDQWAGFYFKFNEAARQVRQNQNITARLELKKRLGCKNFEWYLDNVWPQHFFPKSDRFFGRIKNYATKKCLIKPQKQTISNQPTGLAKLEDCGGDGVSLEMFVMSPEGFIMTDDSVCLDAPERPGIGPPKVRIMACSGHSRQKWEYNRKTKELRHLTNQKCLNLGENKKINEGLMTSDCDGSDEQKWVLEEVPWT